ncbi:MAG: hypothetical protein FD146_739 [Anaerolineaceae bacterium]|nr:MAG: hypothetical protein FD146_739 [Anaerolineaceae bacterium]
MDNRIGRIGTFFILIGCVLVALFIGSVIGKGFNVPYLLLGAVALLLGFSLRRRAAPPPSNGRIGTFFILVGCVLLVLFAGSVIGGEFNILYLSLGKVVGEGPNILCLLLGAAAMFLGISVLKANRRSRQRREEGQQKKDQKKK